ncbi:MAG: dicarboxylate/amino acid:cation symporter [Akkermansiaceae bacterium]|nr:dicarboxylate/amino acid:cation symporter [Akkermansiaceae bacterium]
MSSAVLLDLFIIGIYFAIIIGIDRILDMCRTTVNVTGDMVTAAIVDNPGAPSVVAAPLAPAASGESAPAGPPGSCAPRGRARPPPGCARAGSSAKGAAHRRTPRFPSWTRVQR